MSIRSKISPSISEFITSDARLARKRRREEKKRRNHDEPHTVHYFHQTDDPYSVLAAQALERLTARFDIALQPHIVPQPPDWAAPERERLIAYSRRDAHEVAREIGLEFSDPGRQPNATLLDRAQRIHAGGIDNAAFAVTVNATDQAAWKGDAEVLSSIAKQAGRDAPDATRKELERGGALRDNLGHYLGATFHYAGEWYWGLDRLHFLEHRLYELGAYTGAEPFSALYEPPPSEFATAPAATPKTPPLEFFLSLRSPYTYLAVDRTIALARHYGLELRFRYVLPMVMRGLPVPAKKRTYIALDCKREANRLGIPFGRIADPLGRPTERGLAVLEYAIREGRAAEFLKAFTRAVWSEGVDMDSNRGLRKAVESAGLAWSSARDALRAPEWRSVAEANRNDMFDENLWGVPSFRFGSFSAWGQDRIWLLERRIVEHLNSTGDKRA